MKRFRRYSGWHYLAEFHGATRLVNQRSLHAALRTAAQAAGATGLAVRSHHFGSGYGIAAVALLAESHISVHTWPEHSYAAVDIFMCGEDNDPELALQEMRRRLAPSEVLLRRVRRGYGSEQPAKPRPRRVTRGK